MGGLRENECNSLKTEHHIREVLWMLMIIVYLGVVLINLLNIFICQNVKLPIYRRNANLLYL